MKQIHHDVSQISRHVAFGLLCFACLSLSVGGLSGCSSTSQQNHQSHQDHQVQENAEPVTANDNAVSNNVAANDADFPNANTNNALEDDTSEVPNNTTDNDTGNFGNVNNFNNYGFGNTAVNQAPTNQAFGDSAPAPDTSLPAVPSVPAANANGHVNAGNPPLLADEVLPAMAELAWVGYDYQERAGFVRVELVTQGHPQYNVFQEINRSGQPELVVRFLQTKLRHKVRRDIDASEFHSPVAFVRMREQKHDSYVDVVLTMRDQVKPRLYAKNGNVLLTFQVPDRYFGNTTVDKRVIAKAEVLPGAELMPEIDTGSELPISLAQKQLLAKAYIPDPAAAAFGEVPAPTAGAEIQPVSLPMAPDTTEATDAVAPVENAVLPALPADFEDLPVPPVREPQAATPPVANAVPVNSGENQNAPALRAPQPLPAPVPQAVNPQNLAPQTPQVPYSQPAAPNNQGDNFEEDSGEDAINNNENSDDFDEDTLDNFDDGEGESLDEIDKFDVRTKMKTLPSRYNTDYDVTCFSLASVAQDDLNADFNDDLGQENVGNSQAVNQGNNQAAQQNDADEFSDEVANETQGYSGNPAANPTFNQVSANGQGESNFPANNGFGTDLGPSEGDFDATLDAPTPNIAGNIPANIPSNMPSNMVNNAVAVPVAEPAVNQGVDLQGQETVGQESEIPAATSSGGRKIKLDFRAAPLTEVIRVLSDESGINFVMPPEIGTRNVTTNLTGVPFNDALKAVLDANALGMVELGPNLVRIDSLANLRKDKEDEEARRKSEVRLRPSKILVHRLSYAKVEDAVTMLNSLLTAAKTEDPRVSVQVDKRTNSLILHASPALLTTVKSLLERIDFETPQVKIASRIVEVAKKFNNAFGISWGGNALNDGGRGLGLGNLVFPNYALSKYSVDAGGTENRSGNLNFKFGSVNNSLTLDMALSMEETRGTTEILQSSDVIVEDNVEAAIVAGSSDYFRSQATASGTGATTVTAPEQVDYNLSMKVTPHITADGAVQMKINIVSDSPDAVSAPTATAGKSNRSLNTSLLRKSGETAVIGGVYTTSRIRGESGVPFFSSIPIIGALFRSKSDKQDKRELLVMVTPTIISNMASGNQAAALESAPIMANNLPASNNFSNNYNNAGNNSQADQQNDQANQQNQQNQGNQANYQNNQSNDQSVNENANQTNTQQGENVDE